MTRVVTNYSEAKPVDLRFTARLWREGIAPIAVIHSDRSPAIETDIEMMTTRFPFGKLIFTKTITAASLALALVLAGCQPPAGQGRQKGGDRRGSSMNGGGPKEERTFLAPVMAEKVLRGEIVSTVATTGSVIPYRSQLLRAEESGRLRFAEAWEEGQFVPRNTLIATIESETLVGDIARSRADLELQKENLDIGKKSMSQAVDSYRTVQELYARGISAEKEVSEQELAMQRSVNTHRQNQISLMKAENELKQLEERLERLEIRAPFDGLLVASGTLEGTKPFATSFGSESITDRDGRLISNEFAVCGMIDTSKVFVRADVTSRDIGKVRLGQEARAVIYSTGDLNVTGEVVDISKSVNQDTRAFQVDMLVSNDDLTLKPGMFGRLDIITERRADSIAIPKDLITRRNNRDVVFVVSDATDREYQVAREVVLELGLEGRDMVEVTWGLKEGDAVITRGFEVLQDSSPISPIYSDEPIRPEGDTTDPELTADSDAADDTDSESEAAGS